MTLSADHDRRLALFNEKAEKLLGSRFVTEMTEHPTGIKLSWEADQAGQVTVTGPDDEALAALALTIRFFIQDGDGISFREMARIYDDSSVPEDIRARYRAVREAINGFLDGPSMFDLYGEVISHRRLLEVFLYGSLAHVNREKHETLERWRTIPLVFAMMENAFSRLARRVLFGAVVRFGQ